MLSWERGGRTQSQCNACAAVVSRPVGSIVREFVCICVESIISSCRLPCKGATIVLCFVSTTYYWVVVACVHCKFFYDTTVVRFKFVQALHL